MREYEPLPYYGRPADNCLLTRLQCTRGIAPTLMRWSNLCSEDMTLEAAKSLVVKVMSKSLDSTNLSAEKRTRLPAPTRSLQALDP